MEKEIRKNWLKGFEKTVGIVFLIPIIIWMVAFMFAEIGLGYDISLTFSDAYHQYLPFHSELREILLSGDWGRFLYHWELGFGSSFFGVYSYYLSSPFALFALFFETTELPLYFYIVILLKVGLSGVFAFIFFKHQPNVTQKKAMLFSVLYACIGAMVDRFYNIMWLDAMMILPLTIWTLQRLIHTKHWKGFLVCLIYLFWTNFYMAYMVGIFCFFWFCLEISLYHRGTKKEKWKLFGMFIGCAGLGALICGALLWPTLLMLKENAYSQEISFGETHHLLQSVSDFFIGSFNDLVSVAPGNIYVSSFGLLVAISFLLNPVFSKKERIWFGLFIAFFFASFSIPVLDWVWHGFKMPQGFPNRYAFLLSFLLLYLGCRSFSEKTDFDRSTKECWVRQTLLFYLGLIGIVFCATFFGEFELDTVINSSMMAVNLVFGVIYSIFFFYWKWYHKNLKGIQYLFLAILGAELVLNGFMAAYLLKVSQYSYRGESVTFYESIETALDELELKTTDRLLLPYQNLNASLFHDVKTLENYNTLGHRQANAFLYKLHYGILEGPSGEARNDFIKIKPSLILDSLFGVKYYYRGTFKDDVLVQFPWLEVLSPNWFENPYQLPLAFKIDELALDKIDLIEWGFSAEENQEAFLNALLGLTMEDSEYLDFVAAWDVELVEMDNLVFDDVFGFYVKSKSDELSTMKLKITPPQNVKMDDVQFSLTLSIPIQIEIEDQISFEMIESKRISSSFDEESYILTLTYPKSCNGRLDLLKISYVDDDLAINGLKQLKENVLEEWTFDGPTLESTVDLKENGLYWLSIPYSPNWTATIDGEEVQLKSVQDSFMAIELPEGKYKLSLNYRVSGLETGAIMSGGGILLFSFILIVSNRTKKQKRG